MAQSGAVWTSKNVANQLYEQNRDYNNRQTWHTALAENTAQGSTALADLERQYNTATNEAYVSYLKNKNALQNSAVAGESKDELISQNDLALQEAYNSYRNSLTEGSAQISAAVAEGEAAINKALEEQAQYTADYANLHWDYLEQLYYDYSQGENTIFDSSLWSKYLVDEPVLDAEGNPMYDEQGNPVTEKRIMTRDELANKLYDANGNLTMQGVDFYDQIENAVAQGGTGMSWGDYLAQENEDLYKWATSYNPYNYTFEGTNAGTFRTMVGMASTDNLYSFAERYGGLSETQINEMYEPFKQHLEELNAIDAAKDPDKVIEGIQSINNDLWDMAEDLGLDGDMEELGITRRQTEQWLLDVRTGVKSRAEVAAEYAATVTQYTVVSAGAGAVLGSAAAPVLPGVSTGVGALFGGVLGLIGGHIAAEDEKKEAEAHNKEVTDQLKTEYMKVLDNTINQSLAGKRQADIDFANKMGR